MENTITTLDALMASPFHIKLRSKVEDSISNIQRLLNEHTHVYVVTSDLFSNNLILYKVISVDPSDSYQVNAIDLATNEQELLYLDSNLVKDVYVYYPDSGEEKPSFRQKLNDKYPDKQERKPLRSAGLQAPPKLLEKQSDDKVSVDQFRNVYMKKQQVETTIEVSNVIDTFKKQDYDVLLNFTDCSGMTSTTFTNDVSMAFHRTLESGEVGDYTLMGNCIPTQVKFAGSFKPKIVLNCYVRQADVIDLEALVVACRKIVFKFKDKNILMAAESWTDYETNNSSINECIMTIIKNELINKLTNLTIANHAKN